MRMSEEERECRSECEEWMCKRMCDRESEQETARREGVKERGQGREGLSTVGGERK